MGWFGWYRWKMFGKKKTVQVTLFVHGPATRFVRAGTYEVTEGSKLKALLRQAGLPAGTPAMTFMIEGNRVDLSQRLQGGETVTVLQMAAGG